VLDYPPLQIPQLAAGLEPQLVAEVGPGCRVDVQRLRLASAAVQGQHRLRLQPLPKRMSGREAAQLRQQVAVPAEGELGLDPQLDRGHAEFLQPLRLSAREVPGGELAVGRAAPQRQRAPHNRGRERGVPPTEGRPAPPNQALEPGRVDRALRQLQRVPGTRSADPGRRGHQLAQQRYVDLQQFRRRRRRRLAPDGVDQPAARTFLARTHHQRGKQPPLLGRRHRHQAVITGELKRPEHPNVHRCPPPHHQRHRETHAYTEAKPARVSMHAKRTRRNSRSREAVMHPAHQHDHRNARRQPPFPGPGRPAPAARRGRKQAIRPRIAIAAATAALAGTGILAASGPARADYGRGAAYQIELSANDSGPNGGGIWLWIELNSNGTGDYNGSDCGHGLISAADSGDVTWIQQGSQIVITGVTLNALAGFPATVTVPASYGLYTGTVGSFITLPSFIPPDSGTSQLQVAP
jgi:hypothetical protein